MSSSPTATSDAQEIAVLAATSSVTGSVVSDSGAEGNGRSDGDCDGKSAASVGHDEPPPRANDRAGDLDDRDCDSYEDSSDEENYLRTHGTCEYYPSASNSSRCQIQRSCYDCLNFNVLPESHGCMVNSMGVCSRVSRYNPALDYRLGHAANNASAGSASDDCNTNGSSNTSSSMDADGDATVTSDKYEFLASAATYCEQDDRQCLGCVADQFAAVIFNHSRSGRSQFCYGEGGCVCVAVCEARRMNPPPVDRRCFANALSAKDQDKGAGYGSVFMVAGALVMVVVVVFAIYRIRKRGESVSSDEGEEDEGGRLGGINTDKHRRTSDDNNGADHHHLIVTPDHGVSPIAMAVPVSVQRRSSSSPVGKGSILLNLFNWTAVREALVQHEQLRMHGIDASALPADTTGVGADGATTKSDVQFLDVEPSAPDLDDDKPTAPAVPVMAAPSAPIGWAVRAMAGPPSPSAPSAPDLDDLDYDDDVQAMTAM